MPQGNKAPSKARRAEKRAEQQKIRCAKGCGRQVFIKGTTCADCKARGK